MEEKAYRKTQESILEQFFGDYHAKSHIHVVYKWIAILFCIVVMVVVWIPCQSYDSSDKAVIGVTFMLGLLTSCMYVKSYMNAIDGRGAETRVYPYLRYLPISKKALQIFRLKKLFRFQIKVYLIAQAGQLLFSLIFYHELVWGNLLFPLVCAFVAPFVMGAVTVLLTK